jgi:fucose permease
MQIAGMSLSEAGFASSFYFIFRKFGCLKGFFILSRFSNKKVFLVSVLMIISGILALFSSSVTIIYIGIALFGVGNSNVFPVIFSQALKAKPMQNNEVSGLMIMGIFGGAIIPLLMGIASDLLHKQEGALVILLLCVIYLAGIVGRKIKLY